VVTGVTVRKTAVGESLSLPGAENAKRADSPRPPDDRPATDLPCSSSGFLIQVLLLTISLAIGFGPTEPTRADTWAQRCSCSPVCALWMSLAIPLRLKDSARPSSTFRACRPLTSSSPSSEQTFDSLAC